jgi:hypothetical protein
MLFAGALFNGFFCFLVHMLRIIDELSQDLCCVYYNKVIKDFMIVLLAKDQYDFYQVCKILYLMDFLP